MENSRWIRSSEVAERPDDQGRVVKKDEHWIYVLGRRMKRLSDAETLEQAIEHADQFRPPGKWAYVPSDYKWIRPSWEVRWEGEGWTVWRIKPGEEEFTQASVAVHPSADRARRWVELRLERTEGNLRGPAPRAGKASTAKLPDIRVTPEEREQAFELLKQLGLSYADFVRAALTFAEDHLDGGDWQVIKTEGGAKMFVPRVVEESNTVDLEELED
tara:strand:- start:116 stop:763 length:648 start_codon:yes stop_codon:yes gene_type:complete